VISTFEGGGTAGVFGVDFQTAYQNYYAADRNSYKGLTVGTGLYEEVEMTISPSESKFSFDSHASRAILSLPPPSSLMPVTTCDGTW